MMRRGGRGALALLPIGVLALAPATARADDVVKAGFCRRVAGRACAEPVAPGENIPFDRLARDASGRRVLYFHAVMDVPHARYFILSYARFAEPTEHLGSPEVRSRAPLPESVRALAAAARPGPFADVLNVVVEVKEPSSTFHAFTFRTIAEPCKLAAKVLDADGADLPGSQLIEVEVVEGP